MRRTPAGARQMIDRWRQTCQSLTRTCSRHSFEVGREFDERFKWISRPDWVWRIFNRLPGSRAKFPCDSASLGWHFQRFSCKKSPRNSEEALSWFLTGNLMPNQSSKQALSWFLTRNYIIVVVLVARLSLEACNRFLLMLKKEKLTLSNTSSICGT